MDIKKKCKRQGCNREYTESENTSTSCYYHDGKPIFHDIKKGWTCCEIIVYDWDEFMKIKGCKVGCHTTEASVKPDFFKSQTVSTAQKGIDNNPTQSVKDVKEYEKEQKRIEDEKKLKEEAKPKIPIVSSSLN